MLTDKFKAIFHYVFTEQEMWEGAASLERVLHTIFMIDRQAYSETGQSITDSVWHKGSLNFPTTPVPTGWEESWENLLEELEIKQVE